ncbi:hypothetical protein COCVIDRAFT_115999 [Bipolaris victoriae FI3]|uniref:Xaa-Pro dipeptidyl-peptidase C-terminal domain-containing protein n=1 Tax=Bipolaris victoriae (strain FI3) TaxID=930091 RepID=W7E3W9_BIPV3|nr:hypothetical protein COCVIDRAFT_115999 [Bipolaris victoriae FI3]
MIYEKDQEIALRDGVKIFADVFRPIDSDTKPVPAILPWSIYGKTGTGLQSLDKVPWRVGIPRSWTSGLEKWEAPDPAEWIQRGYAVVNTDARGTFQSEGDMPVYGTQEGRDGHDAIEWIGVQPWCNGAVGMAGNSWLGSTQWFIGAEQPPHLKALAPWEGLGDYYRESLCRGGIPDYSFWGLLLSNFTGGLNNREHVEDMIDKYPLWNAYWEDKRPKLWNINVPMYATASYSTGLHTEGSLRGYFLSSSAEKWLRICSTQEWHDIYQPNYIDELQSFFDKYLKGIQNDWEATPRMRLALLGYNQPSIVDRPISRLPPENFVWQSFYLDGLTSTLQRRPRINEHALTYDATVAWSYPPKEYAGFRLTFEKYTELCGFSKAKLYMSTPDHDDMDVYVVIQKLDKNGKMLQQFNIPFRDLPPEVAEKDIPGENIMRYIGPNGRLRASHRAVQKEPDYPDEKLELLSPAYVWHPHDKVEKLKKDQVVELEIMLWAGGMIFERGESLRLDILGHDPRWPEFKGLDKSLRNFNVGKHRVHTGGEYPSSLYIALSN